MERSVHRGPGSQAERAEQDTVPLFLQRMERRVESSIEAAAIRESSFADLYGAEVVARDLRRVGELQDMFDRQTASSPSARESAIWGKTLEAFLHEQIQENAFFGDAKGVKTSRFDDYVNGVDQVILFPRPEGLSHLGLSIDFTFASPDKKLDRLLPAVREGKLATVKYFEVNEPGLSLRGELRTPKVIVAISRAGIRPALAQWAEGKGDLLKRHPLQMLILRQIADQLDVYGALAPEHAKGHYKTAESQVLRVIAQKRGEGLAMGELKHDPVHQILQARLGALLR